MMIEDMSFNQTARLEIQTPIGIPTTQEEDKTEELVIMKNRF